MRMFRLLQVMGFRTSVGVPLLGHTKGEPFHEGELLKIGGRFDKFNLQGNFEIFDSEWSVRRASGNGPIYGKSIREMSHVTYARSKHARRAYIRLAPSDTSQGRNHYHEKRMSAEKQS